jgi:glycosyltransferase involved in cell wall biosynthesis
MTRTPEPLRILHLTGNLDRGGVETWLRNVFLHAQEAPGRPVQMDVLVVSPDPRPGVYDDDIRAAGGRVFYAPPGGSRAFWPFVWRTLRREGPYTAVHSHIHHFGGLVLLLARLLGVPGRVALSHNDTRREDGAASAGRSAYLRVTRAALNRAVTHRQAVSSEAASALFGPDWQRLGTRLMTLGVDVAALQRAQDPALQVRTRQALGLTSQDPIWGHVGLFRAQKNHTFLLEVFAASLQRHGPAHLLLVGDGPERPEIERRMRAMGLDDRVHLLGARPDVPALLGVMDVFVFPSLFEGLSLALVEAQAAGLRGVVSDTVSRECEQVPGSLTFVPLSASPETWADVVTQTLRAGKLPTQDLRFDVAHTTRDLLAFYRSLTP